MIWIRKNLLKVFVVVLLLLSFYFDRKTCEIIICMFMRRENIYFCANYNNFFFFSVMLTHERILRAWLYNSTYVTIWPLAPILYCGKYITWYFRYFFQFFFCENSFQMNLFNYFWISQKCRKTQIRMCKFYIRIYIQIWLKSSSSKMFFTKKKPFLQCYWRVMTSLKCKDSHLCQNIYFLFAKLRSFENDNQKKKSSSLLIPKHQEVTLTHSSEKQHINILISCPYYIKLRNDIYSYAINIYNSYHKFTLIYTHTRTRDDK